MIPSQNTQVVAEGLARLTSFYRNQTVVPALTQAWLLSVQELENVAWQLFQLMNLDPDTPPTGDALDRIVAIAGLTRMGLTDSQLWNAFKLELLVLASRGRSEDMLKIANALTATSIAEYPIATMVLSAWNIPGTVDFPTLCLKLGQAKDAGAYCVLQYSTWDPSTNLVLASSRGGAGSGTSNLLASSYGTVSGAGVLAAMTQIVGS